MVRVMGLGDNVVDKYMHTMTMYPGGNAFNIAVYAKLMGYESAYMGNFGDDPEAEHVYGTARKLGIDVSHCRFWEGENGAAKVRIENGDRVFVGSNRGGISNEHPLKLTGLDEKYIKGFDLVHTSIFSHIEGQLAALRRAAAWLSMDLSNRADDAYMKQVCPYVDCVCISCGEDMGEEAVRGQIHRIMALGCRRMVIATRGGKGAVVYVDGKFYRQRPCLVRAVDTMGAGDSFITCFLVNYIHGARYAVDFPGEPGGEGPEENEKAGPGENAEAGLSAAADYMDLVVRLSLYRAAVFASQTCLRGGSFGFGVRFE